ncbi:uncharacterized protein AC631_05518 [Debaryomyces fabryi]|uniref:Glucose N-acetyltransferase 1 n=1 Tax=Debaryomyces fabryi TaxID=58627 RepID=A0A0V1PRA0_9ASCO|nr:uncharacterized protein AC631_05518 [Debaryomyces fabryi]KRZ98730.1 hypothetical protein AC631_05518 [Debaryomyces fabryi]CUM52522.1 unnamed protein product [Debaryomyces fabryi]
MKLNPDSAHVSHYWEYILLFSILLYFIITQLIFIPDESIATNLKVIPLEIISLLDDDLHRSSSVVNYAYVQYATDFEYLNLAIINFIVLRKALTKIPSLVVLFNKELQEDKNRFELLKNLTLQYHISLKPVSIIESHNAESLTWSKSFTKLHIFNEVSYDRIVYFDADSMLLNTQWNDNIESNLPENLDELFNIPDVIDIALPQAYWLTKHTKASRKINSSDTQEQEYQEKIKSLVNDVSKSFNDSLIFEKLPPLVLKNHKLNHRHNFFATHIMVLKPSSKTFKELKGYVHNPWLWSFYKRQSLRSNTDYDMEILNKFIDDSLQENEDFKVGILPHKVYGVLTGEFRELLHEAFLSEPQFLPFVTSELNDQWLPSEIIRNVKLIHFSDSPIPKPWEGINKIDFYNSLRIYCNDKDFDEVVYNSEFPTQWKPRLTTDCDSVNFWNWVMKEQQKLQNEFWMV